LFLDSSLNIKNNLHFRMQTQTEGSRHSSRIEAKK
jgi:hypothetical protein